MLAGIVIIVLVVIGLYSAGSESKKLVIGAVIPQTGFGAYWGDPVLKGIKLAEADLKVKYPNESISVLVEDSQSKAPQAVSAAQKLLSIDKAEAIYSEFSGMSSAIAPVAKAAGKVLTYSAFNQKIAEDNATTLKTFINFETACEDFGAYLNDSTKKVLIVSSIGDVAPYCVRGLEKYLPKENIKVVDGVTDTDFKTLLLQNKTFNADYIIPIMYENGSYALIKQNNQLGLKASFYCYKQDCVTEKLLAELPKEWTEGIIYFQMPLNDEFVTKIKALYPEMTVDGMQGAANAYQSIMVLGEGLVKCSSGDGQCVANHMANTDVLSYSAYKGASFKNRVLTANLSLWTIHNGESVLVK